MPRDTERGAHEVLKSYLVRHKLKRSEQREVILDALLRSDRHLSAEELLRAVKRRHPEVGRTTVYRTLKLLTQAGLARELVIDGQAHYERGYQREHHDHFICTSCGVILEFSSPDIERLQEEFAARLGFAIEAHRHEIYGRCARCGEADQAAGAARSPGR
jgi:Fur family transcriptional regulator, ferric uptake regulator